MPIHRNYAKDFFKTWKPEMAYILGFLFADGNLTRTKRDSHFVAFYSSDRELLKSMRKCFGSDHKISLRSSPSGKVYRMQVGSREWFDDLCALGLTPGKVKRMAFPVIPKDIIGDFIRGYFDGDGNVWAGVINKKRENSTQVILSAFTSASQEFLEALHRELRKKGLIGGSIYMIRGKNCARLSFSTADTLKLYEIMYTMPHTLFLHRKKVVFDTFIEMRP